MLPTFWLMFLVKFTMKYTIIGIFSLFHNALDLFDKEREVFLNILMTFTINEIIDWLQMLIICIMYFNR